MVPWVWAAGTWMPGGRLAPLAATRMGETPAPDAAALAGSVFLASVGSGVALVEGAGGLFVPLGEGEDFGDLARELALPIVLVARDGLGVLSHTSAVLEAARARELPIAALVLTRFDDGDDPSRQHNAGILAEHGVPVHVFGRCDDDDDALAEEAERCGLVDRVLRTLTR